MPNIPVSTTKGYYQNSLHVTIRRDFDRGTGWAFVAAPQYFCANTTQLPVAWGTHHVDILQA